MQRLSGSVNDQGVLLADAVVLALPRVAGVIPGSSPPRVGRWVLAHTTTDAAGVWQLDCDYSGPVIVMCWDTTGRQLAPMVLGPVEA
ncbi:hypothetical protein JD491_01660 [Aeromonas caviae]|uniref:hypothetical protein n=1 Tax=Aeromonas caviae TaxID=648 RepID=UPI0019230684|nr:hypothetical protein [Aeromonas caviae]MBL0576353.1 hypothetical protein [Aeromonas caviae]